MKIVVAENTRSRQREKPCCNSLIVTAPCLSYPVEVERNEAPNDFATQHHDDAIYASIVTTTSCLDQLIRRTSSQRLCRSTVCQKIILDNHHSHGVHGYYATTLRFHGGYFGKCR